MKLRNESIEINVEKKPKSSKKSLNQEASQRDKDLVKRLRGKDCPIDSK